MYTRVLLSLLFLLAGGSVVLAQKKQGQGRLDSLLAEVSRTKEDKNAVGLMNDISFAYEHINPDEGLKWGRKQLALAEKLDWNHGKTSAFQSIANSYSAKGAYPEALEAYFEALRIAEAAFDTGAYGSISSNISLLYFRQKDYSKALEWGFKALKDARANNNDKGLTEVIFSNIANVYAAQGKQEAALKYELAALQIAEEIDDKRGVVIQTGNIGSDYAQLGQYNKAIAYHFKALRKAEELGIRQSRAINLGNAGEAYFQIAAGSTEPRPDSLVPADKSANLSKAVAYLNMGIAACRETGFMEGIPEFADYLSKAYALQGDHQAALSAYKTGKAISDSLYNIANKEKIAALETQRAVALKDKDIRIAQLEVAKKRDERVFYISGIALLLVILGILLYNFRRHERSRRRIKELQDLKISQLDEAVRRRTEQLGSMRQTIATDFHDQTGNMLAAITHQAATLELKLQHQQEVLPIVQSIITNSNELYASSKDFLWNLNHDSDDPAVLFDYLRSYGQRFYNQFDIAFSATVTGGGAGPQQLQPFAALNLIYIFKEAMSNVVKHSGADEVLMELRWEERNAIYSLEDNGSWKEADKSCEHYGLSNMERRCCKSGFGYSLEPGPSGTRITVSLSLSKDYINYAECGHRTETDRHH